MTNDSYVITLWKCVDIVGRGCWLQVVLAIFAMWLINSSLEIDSWKLCEIPCIALMTNNIWQIML